MKSCDRSGPQGLTIRALPWLVLSLVLAGVFGFVVIHDVRRRAYRAASSSATGLREPRSGRALGAPREPRVDLRLDEQPSVALGLTKLQCRQVTRALLDARAELAAVNERVRQHGCTLTARLGRARAWFLIDAKLSDSFEASLSLDQVAAFHGSGPVFPSVTTFLGSDAVSVPGCAGPPLAPLAPDSWVCPAHKQAASRSHMDAFRELVQALRLTRAQCEEVIVGLRRQDERRLQSAGFLALTLLNPFDRAESWEETELEVSAAAATAEARLLATFSDEQRRLLATLDAPFADLAPSLGYLRSCDEPISQEQLQERFWKAVEDSGRPDEEARTAARLALRATGAQGDVATRTQCRAALRVLDALRSRLGSAPSSCTNLALFETLRALMDELRPLLAQIPSLAAHGRLERIRSIRSLVLAAHVRADSHLECSGGSESGQRPDAAGGPTDLGRDADTHFSAPWLRTCPDGLTLGSGAVRQLMTRAGASVEVCERFVAIVAQLRGSLQGLGMHSLWDLADPRGPRTEDILAVVRTHEAMFLGELGRPIWEAAKEEGIGLLAAAMLELDRSTECQ